MKCAEKRRYRSQAKAHQALVRVKAVATRRGFKTPTHTYGCSECGGWHITTTAKRPA